MRVSPLNLLLALLASEAAYLYLTIVYNLPSNPANLLLVTIPIFLLTTFLLENRRKNVRKWRRHPTTFPSPYPGSLLGPYFLRPWQNELADIGKRSRRSQALKLAQNKQARRERMRQAKNQTATRP